MNDDVNDARALQVWKSVDQAMKAPKAIRKWDEYVEDCHFRNVFPKRYGT